MFVVVTPGADAKAIMLLAADASKKDGTLVPLLYHRRAIGKASI